MDIFETEKKREFETVLPLVNIVFLLLIFFMLAGAFTKPDMFTIATPEATHSEHEANNNDMTILMSANNEFAIETTPYAKSELIALITNTLTDKKLTVQLKADENVKSQDLIAFIEALSSTGLDSIRLLTTVSNTSTHTTTSTHINQ